MINRIIDFSIQNKFIVALFTLSIVLAGIWSMTQVPIDAVPDITNNQVQIITQAPNLGTEDIEQFVTYPIEIGMSNLPNVEEIRSISRFGLSVVTVVFKDAMGTYLPRQLVTEKLAEVKENIPEGFGEPGLGPISTGLGEIYQYTLKVEPEYADQYSIVDLRSIQDWIIERQMAMLPGVVEINAIGGGIKQYEIAVKPDELKAIGINISDVFKALENNNQNTGGAYIEKNHQAHFIRGEGLVRSLEDIKNISIKTINGIPIRIADVAQVQYGSAVRYGALTQDGKGEVVGGLVMMLKGANSNNVIKDVKERMQSIQKSLPKGIVIETLLDRSKLIGKTTSTVTTNLIEGALIVIFVLIFLLGNWRGGLIVASTIPLSLLFAFILMNLFDVWVNLMSLGAIDFGIIIDGAVIIVESTVFLIAGHVLKNKNFSQKQRDTLTSKASKKMMNAAFFGQLIILIVFLPILALEGIEGKMFKPMALTFIFAMIGAMILCLTYVPMISALVLRPSKKQSLSYGDRFVIGLENLYQPILSFVLSKGKIVLGIAILLFGLSIYIFKEMGGEFIPELDEGDIAFHILLKPGSSLTEMIETTTKVEGIIKSNFPEVEKIVSRIGVAEVPTDPMPFDIADAFVILKPKKEWVSATSKTALVEKMKKAIEIVPGVNYEFTQPIEMRFNELLEGVREDIAIKIYGEDIQILSDKAKEITKIIAGTPGIGDMKAEATTGLPQINIQYKRNKLAQYGLQISELNRLVETAFAGKKAGVIFEGEKRFDLVVRLDNSSRNDIKDIENLYISLNSGTQIPLREVAKINYKPGPMQISRDNTNRRTYVGINVRGRDVKSLVEEIKTKLDAKLHLPPGYFIRYGGAFENLERASNRLKTVVPISLFLIFILIYFALKSLPQTLIIFLAIPMASIGGVMALFFRDMPFSISAGVGFIVLFGVAVLNGLVMISGLNELKEEGVTHLKDRIFQGTRRRIRPILLTALTDVLGFLPMAISTSSGAEVQRPLATVVIGGLFTATLLTLFILPILYHWVENFNMQKIKLQKTALASIFVLFFILPSTSQENKEHLKAIDIQKAVSLAESFYPDLKVAEWNIEKQKALAKATFDLGTTEIFTAGDEVGKNSGLYTLVGMGQRDINIFGIKTKKNLFATQINTSKHIKNNTKAQIALEVKQAWNHAYFLKNQWNLHQRLDSIYQQFKKAVSINYEVENISELEYLSAKNTANQVHNKKEQLAFDYRRALVTLNSFLGTGIQYSVTTDVRLEPIIEKDLSILNHPQYKLSSGRVEEAAYLYKKTKNSRYPLINLETGLQRVNRELGFFSYQAGISLPLFSKANSAHIQAAKIEKEIALENVNTVNMQLQKQLDSQLLLYKKWQKTWLYYKKSVLPYTEKQRNAALFAYKEGSIDYTSFVQLMNQSIALELEGQEAYYKYINSIIRLEIFKK